MSVRRRLLHGRETVPTHARVAGGLSLNVALYDAWKEGKRSVAVQSVEDGWMDGWDGRGCDAHNVKASRSISSETTTTRMMARGVNEVAIVLDIVDARMLFDAVDAIFLFFGRRRHEGSPYPHPGTHVKGASPQGGGLPLVPL